MDQPKKKARLTPEEQKEKERLMRAGSPVVRKGSGNISEAFGSCPSRKITKDGRCVTF
jgi:hypothetical protein